MMFRAQVVADNSDWGVPRWAKLVEQRIALQRMQLRVIAGQI